MTGYYFKLNILDVDFNDVELNTLTAFLSQATATLKSWNLFVNEDKTAFCHIFLADKEDTDDNGDILSGNEPWRKSVILGSLLCSKADLERRTILGYVAFHKYRKTWNNKIPLNKTKRLHLYNATLLLCL